MLELKTAVMHLLKCIYFFAVLFGFSKVILMIQFLPFRLMLEPNLGVSCGSSVF